jgi:ATP-dependent protease ClpP protease subunit
VTWTSSFGVGGLYTPPRPDATPATTRTGVSVDDYLATAKQRHCRAVAAGFDPGPPLQIAITGEITAAKAHFVKRQLARNVFADVVLTFDSRGGSAREGIALYRAIRYRLGRTTGHVRGGGLCCSAALDIYLGCDIRTAHADATFLLHRTGLTIDKSVRWTAANLPAALAEIQKTDAWTLRTIASRTGARLDHIMAEAATERPMTAMEAWHLRILTREPRW